MADPPEVIPTGNKPTEVLAYSPNIPSASGKGGYPGFTPLANDDIERLIKRHPRGKLFNLDPEGIIASSSDGDEFPATYEVPKAKKLTPSKAEAGLLFKHFPSARQVIFLPLWDASASRFSTFFAYTTSEFRTFSNNPDFLYCIAFCNCVMTEITRLATTAADQQKSDFIGSVSHELRSPLHGILASCEFLGDTETSSFQRSLIDTADSCARTLLDTINMVLDYSKINAFERNASKARRKKGQLATGGMQSAGQPQLNIYGDVDLAAITEEVVEGVATGQVFKDSLTGVDAIDLTGDVSKQSVPGKKDVEIILDISPRASPKDWVFITQPGAFRRIIMNIFGNSLKYTRQGFIRVKLEAQNPPKHKSNSTDSPPATLVRLTITDTGQGMSPQFMRTKLYTPFAQENSIAPGTGLGLSLVKSMVTMLNGEINIQSAVGVGTEVTVKFPMTLSAHTSSGGSSSGTSGSTPTSAGSIERIKDESLQIVQQKTRGRRAMLFPDKSAHKSVSESTKMVRDAINRYLTGWFGFEVTYPLSKTNVPDIIITDEADLPDLLKVLPNALTGDDRPMIIVLCTATSRRSNAYMISKSERLEAVSHPFGPYKLAKTIRVCLDKLERNAIMESESEALGPPPLEPSEERDFAADEVATAVQQMTISNPNPDIPDITVIKAGTVVAHGDSIHAQLLSENEPTSMSGGSQEAPEYPFPAEDGTISPSNLQTSESERPLLSSRRTISPTTTEIANTARILELATPMSFKGALASDLPNSKSADPIARAPRMLLVDDNNVNLRLLQTFMKKRKYTDIFSAEDGQQAVSIYRNLLTSQPPRPPDIIFMDISMPIMNGFEATRRIREIESEFRRGLESPMVTPPSALIIALTGLASGRDQSEAFTSGFDLYLVKPISFREVGRLLDNWEKSGGSATVGVPHGAAVAPAGGEGKENVPGAGAGEIVDLPPA
jgi:signal transduction histidine kinase/CheY-like chemotaxis protein